MDMIGYLTRIKSEIEGSHCVADRDLLIMVVIVNNFSINFVVDIASLKEESL
jgi:hypothetical protein